MSAISFFNSSNFSTKQCANCKKIDETLLKCSRCKAVFYCNNGACQKKNWPEHKKVCLKPIPQINLDRIWDKVKKESLNWQSNSIMGHDAMWTMLASMSALENDSFLTSLPSLKNNEKKLALDLGVGGGGLTVSLLQHNWHVIALDSSKPVLDMLTKKVEVINKAWIDTGRLTLIHNSVEDYQFPSVDLIVANDILPYIDPLKVKMVWEKAYQALIEGGYLLSNFFTTTNKKHIMAQRLMGAWISLKEEEIKALITLSNYALEKCEYRNDSKESLRFIGKKLKLSS